MRLALWQGESPAGDVDSALAGAERALAAAGAMGAQALVLPEVWVPGYNQPISRETAIAVDGPEVQRLARAARSAGCALVFGFAEACADGRLCNTAMCIGRDGEVLASYRKVQLYGPREKAIYAPGDAYVTFRLGQHEAALLICYDVEFAQHVKALADRGVTLILVPTANMAPFVHVARHTVLAMATNHGVSIVYANYCGIEGDLTYVGLSLITGPHGEILAQAGETPALLVADLPPRDAMRLSTQSSDYRAIR